MTGILKSCLVTIFEFADMSSFLRAATGDIVGARTDKYPNGKTSINLINNLAGLGLASSYANHSSSGVTSKHYIQKVSATEIRNTLIVARKKLGIF